MGVGRATSSRSYSGVSPHHSDTGSRRTEYVYVDKPTPLKLPNPDPFNFRVIMEKKIGHHLVAWVLYPDATNFEGLKILLFRDTDSVKLESSLDPHFLHGTNLVARFYPDEEGWELAQQVAGMI